MLKCYGNIMDISNRAGMRQVLAFFDGYLYPAVYAALALISSYVGLEAPFFVLTTLCILFTSVFSKDSKPVWTPIVLMMYSLSLKHTPSSGSEYFTNPGMYALIGVLAVLLVAAFVWRLAAYPAPGKSFFASKTRFGGGLLFLAAALVLNGAFYRDSAIFKNLLLGVILALSFVLVYIYLYNTTAYRRDNATFLAYLFFLAGLIVTIQILVILASGKAFLPDGSIDKNMMSLGWGAPNTVGGMLAIFISASMFLAYRVRGGFLFYLISIMQFICVCCTQSRGAILVSGIILVVGAILLSVIASRNRFSILCSNIGLILAIVFSKICFSDVFDGIFSFIIDRGFSDSARFDIWSYGIENFLKSPAFGVGFYAPLRINDPDFTYGFNTWLFPDMYHNMAIQIIASCGLFGIFALVCHFVQVLLAAGERPNSERLFYLAIVLLIVGTSMLENHIFHIFPALLYSMALLFWEKALTDRCDRLPLGTINYQQARELLSCRKPPR